MKLECPVDVYDFEVSCPRESPNRAYAIGMPALSGKWCDALGLGHGGVFRWVHGSAYSQCVFLFKGGQKNINRSNIENTQKGSYFDTLIIHTS